MSKKSRREFLATTAAVSAAAAVPMILPSRVIRGQGTPSGRVRVGQIGAGRIGTDHDMPGVMKSGLADYVAVCDLDSRRAPIGKTFMEGYYRDTLKTTVPDISVYTKYEELLARRDIDAVVISLPDHQHAQVALAAARAGKHIYLQKPFTMTYEEGMILRDAVARAGIIFQIGSQQRSWGGDDQFRTICELVRNGRVGTLKAVEIGLPVDPTEPDRPEMPVPANLDYDRWLGPTPQVYYTEHRVHSQSDIKSRPGWLRNESYCLGMITGWGAHHFDTAHWGMDTELTGPSKIEGKGEFPKNKVWNVHGAYHIELQYPRNIKMTVTDKFDNGIRFIGDEGWLWCSRGDAQVSASDPTAGAKPVPKMDASDKKLLEPMADSQKKVRLPVSAEHHLNWLQAVKSGKHDNVAPAPIAHRSTAACILSWIAMKLEKPLTWDAQAEKFVNDAQANAMLSRPERAPYGAVRMAKV